VTEVISRRDGAIRIEGENFAKIKMDINQNRDALEDRKDILKKDKDENRASRFWFISIFILAKFSPSILIAPSRLEITSVTSCH
jgi:hypothetical protein